MEHRIATPDRITQRCAVCDCSVGSSARAWDEHVAGIRHRRRALGAAHFGSANIEAATIFEPDDSESRRFTEHARSGTHSVARQQCALAMEQPALASVCKSLPALVADLCGMSFYQPVLSHLMGLGVADGASARIRRVLDEANQVYVREVWTSPNVPQSLSTPNTATSASRSCSTPRKRMREDGNGAPSASDGAKAKRRRMLTAAPTDLLVASDSAGMAPVGQHDAALLDLISAAPSTPDGAPPQCAAETPHGCCADIEGRSACTATRHTLEIRSISSNCQTCEAICEN